MATTSWWPTDYFDSRDQFVKMAEASSVQLESHSVKATGPAGEALSVEVASLVSTNDEHRIILISGIHGVEGFIGASIQVQVLQQLAKGRLPNRTGVILIHAANPWGFAHLRRVDDNNIDMNRNFFAPNDTRPTSHPMYTALDPVINARATPSAIGDVKYWFNACNLMVRHRGIAALFKPIAEGQYDFDRGVFYGGSQPSEACKLLQKLVLRHAANVKQISVLDVHSGLGPKAIATLIGNSNRMPMDNCLDWLKYTYGKPAYIDSSASNAYDASATFSQWCKRALNDREFLYLCIEIGTTNPISLFSALRRENQAHHWSGINSKTYKQTKQALLKVFAPTSHHWRSKSTSQGLDVFNKTLKLTSSKQCLNQ